MKKIVILFILSLFTMTMYGQSYARRGDDFVSSSTTSRTKKEPVKTTHNWIVGDKSYPIYRSDSGSCFIIKTSQKTGKEYRQYLGEEVSREICREDGFPYKGKSKSVK